MKFLIPIWSLTLKLKTKCDSNGISNYMHISLVQNM